MNSWKEENVLTGIFLITLICHGMFFFREWLILGAVILLYRIGKWCSEQKNNGPWNAEAISKRLNPQKFLPMLRQKGIKIFLLILKPNAVFCLLIIFSLLGLFHPIRSAAGWLEIIRWLVYFSIFLWGKSLAGSPGVREKIVERLLLLSLILTVITFLPGSEKIWASPGPPQQGEFVFTFGYANAAAAFLGCLLLILQKDEKVNLVCFTIFIAGLASSGSRAAVCLFLFFSLIILGKKVLLHVHNQKAYPLGFIGFRLENTWRERTKLVVLLAAILFWSVNSRFDASWQHLFDWSFTGINERFYYYLDSFRLAFDYHFFPSAGGWLAFPFIQTVTYWTTNPHSSLCSILINQGLAGVILLLIWAGKGIVVYLKGLIREKDMTVFCCQSAVLFLGLHSLIDADLSFGSLGILFWLLAGMYSK